MNRRFVSILSRCSGAYFFPASCKSTLQTCRCFTHFGASQDSRAGKALR
ncbi:hypothetical protein [Vagococcus sp. WN89Y]